jgi:hypothetical protein
LLQGSGFEWRLTEQHINQFRNYFDSLDADRDGLILGKLQQNMRANFVLYSALVALIIASNINVLLNCLAADAKQFFLRSQLATADLGKIWYGVLSCSGNIF